MAIETIIEDNRIKTEKQRLKYHEKSVEEKAEINKKRSEKRAASRKVIIIKERECELEPSFMIKPDFNKDIIAEIYLGPLNFICAFCNTRHFKF